MIFSSPKKQRLWLWYGDNDKWCAFMSPLEPFFKRSSRREGFPTPFPAVGTGVPTGIYLQPLAFSGVYELRSTPDFVRFWLARGILSG